MIYVDPLLAYPQKAKAGAERYFGEGKESCHMFTDGQIEELHTFALCIGMKRVWFQDHPTLPHYDLTEARRKKAIRMGAVEVTHEERICIQRNRMNPEEGTCDGESVSSQPE